MSESDASPLSPRDRELLEIRAARLARPAGADAAQAEGEEAITFTLARERYAIPAAEVWAVFRLATLVRLPGAESPVVGVTRWRGDVLTLLDIRSLLGAPATALDDLAIVVVLGQGQPEFGILADTLGEPMRISTLLPLASRRGPAGDPVVRGVTPDAHLVLDAAALVRRQVGGRVSSPSSVISP